MDRKAGLGSHVHWELGGFFLPAGPAGRCNEQVQYMSCYRGYGVLCWGCWQCLHGRASSKLQPLHTRGPKRTRHATVRLLPSLHNCSDSTPVQVFCQGGPGDQFSVVEEGTISPGITQIPHIVSIPLILQVFCQGDPGDRFYVVEEGSFSITNEEGLEVAKCNKGQCFGELALLRQEAR